jgi:hypothetical protein
LITISVQHTRVTLSSLDGLVYLTDYWLSVEVTGFYALSLFERLIDGAVITNSIVSVVECLFYIHNCFATISFFNCKKIMNEE